MPLWKIHHPVGAYTAADKKEFAEAITRVYEAVPIPKFYVVVLFEEVAADSFYVGGDSHDRFVRINIDQTFELSEVLNAWQYSQAGHTRGKSVVRIGD